MPLGEGLTTMRSQGKDWNTRPRQQYKCLSHACATSFLILPSSPSPVAALSNFPHLVYPPNTLALTQESKKSKPKGIQLTTFKGALFVCVAKLPKSLVFASFLPCLQCNLSTLLHSLSTLLHPFFFTTLHKPYLPQALLLLLPLIFLRLAHISPTLSLPFPTLAKATGT